MSLRATILEAKCDACGKSQEKWLAYQLGSFRGTRPLALSIKAVSSLAGVPLNAKLSCLTAECSGIVVKKLLDYVISKNREVDNAAIS